MVGDIRHTVFMLQVQDQDTSLAAKDDPETLTISGLATPVITSVNASLSEQNPLINVSIVPNVNIVPSGNIVSTGMLSPFELS